MTGKAVDSTVESSCSMKNALATISAVSRERPARRTGVFDAFGSGVEDPSAITAHHSSEAGQLIPRRDAMP